MDLKDIRFGIEYSSVIDIPVCGTCFEKGDLFEGMIDLSENNAAHPIGLA